MAVTSLALRFSSTSARLEEIVCSECGATSIPAPEGATASARFTCPACCASLLESCNKETALMFAAIAAEIDARGWQEGDSPAVYDDRRNFANRRIK